MCVLWEAVMKNGARHEGYFAPVTCGVEWFIAQILVEVTSELLDCLNTVYDWIHSRRPGVGWKLILLVHVVSQAKG